MNPIHKKIPVLIHKGKPICESLVTDQYIDEVWNDKFPLLPTDPYQRAHARFCADFIDKKIYDCSRRIWGPEGDDKEKAKEKFLGCLKLLEGELGEKPFIGGESLGFVYVALLPFYTWFHTYETYGKFSIEAECPTLLAWVKRCLEKESVLKSLADPLEVYERISVFISNGYGKQ